LSKEISLALPEPKLPLRWNVRNATQRWRTLPRAPRQKAVLSTALRPVYSLHADALSQATSVPYKPLAENRLKQRQNRIVRGFACSRSQAKLVRSSKAKNTCEGLLIFLVTQLESIDAMCLVISHNRRVLPILLHNFVLYLCLLCKLPVG